MGQTWHWTRRWMYSSQWKGKWESWISCRFFVLKRIISAIKWAEFVSDKMSYIVLRVRCFNIIVLNVHAPIEYKIDNVKDSFYKELECVFDKFPEYRTSNFVRRSQCQSWFRRHFLTNNWKLEFTQINGDNEVGVVNFATSKSTMFLHCNIHKLKWSSPDWKTHN
jgi:hypothetical protein